MKDHSGSAWRRKIRDRLSKAVEEGCSVSDADISDIERICHLTNALSYIGEAVEMLTKECHAQEIHIEILERALRGEKRFLEAVRKPQRRKPRVSGV